MNKEEVAVIGELVKQEYLKYLKFEQSNSLFNQNIKYQIFFEDYQSDGYELTDKIMAALNYFIQFDEENLKWIKELCFKHYEMCIAVIDYGIDEELLEKYNNDFGIANKELFNIYTPEEAIKKAKIDSVDILEQENDGEVNMYTIINFKVPWENEHGMKFHFLNNEFVEVE